MTRHRLSIIALLALLGLSSVVVRADSLPVIQGAVSGIELCQQSVCGAAIFVGLFRGRVGANPLAIGTVSVLVTHNPLPPPDFSADITGGLWTIQLLNGRRFSGPVTGGSLFNNDDGTFGVSADMLMLGGGIGTMTFNGVLSHNVFPPTINGVISQK